MSTKIIAAHGGTEAAGYRDVLQALDTAAAAGADMFEFDVRRCGDGSLVVHHDSDIAGRSIAALDYSAAAAAASALGYRLPRLDDVLDRARGRLQLDVELKEQGYERSVLDHLIARGFAVDSFVVTSFEAAAVTAICREFASVRTGLLVYDVTGPMALQMFRNSPAAFLGPDHRLLDETTLREAEASSIPLFPWTVNEPASMQRLLNATAVFGVITDRPSVGVRIRDAAPR